MRKTRPRATDADPLFASANGERHDTANLYNRMLKPAMRRANIPHGGFHRLRHTCATHLIRNGASPSQAQLWLGHHDPGFTARVYVHLDAGDLLAPEILESLLLSTGLGGANSAPAAARNNTPASVSHPVPVTCDATAT